MAVCNVQCWVPIVWPIMHVLCDPENRHNRQIWIDLLVYSFIFKEPKIFQRALLMFIIILMKSKSSQKRRELQEDDKSKHNNMLYLSSLLGLYIYLSLFPFDAPFCHFVLGLHHWIFQCKKKKGDCASNEPSATVREHTPSDPKHIFSDIFYVNITNAHIHLYLYLSLWIYVKKMFSFC